MFQANTLQQSNNQNKRTLRSGLVLKQINVNEPQARPGKAAVDKTSKRTTTSRVALGEKTNVVQEQDSKGAKKPVVKAKTALPVKVLPAANKRPQSEVSEVSRSTQEKLVVPPAAEVAEKPLTRRRKSILADNSNNVAETAVIECAAPAATRERIMTRRRSKEKSDNISFADSSDPPVFAGQPCKQSTKVEKEIAKTVVEHVNKRVKTREWDDLDADDEHDPLMVSEYVNEIFAYMKELEIESLPRENYMEHQEELSWKMRSILVDWLLEVHMKFRLLPETLFLTMNIVDRFLAARVVSIKKLQLVGITAMFIAAKYEEIIAPSISNFLYVCEQKQISEEEIINAERYILQVLGYNLSYPNPLSFLRRCSKADKYDNQTRTLAKYLMEISLVDHRFISITPSKVAAGALYLARVMLSRSPWDANLTHYSGYSEVELEECVSLMLNFLAGPEIKKFETIYKKYSARKFMKAAIFAQDWVDKNHADGTIIMNGAVKVGVHEVDEKKE